MDAAPIGACNHYRGWYRWGDPNVMKARQITALCQMPKDRQLQMVSECLVMMAQWAAQCADDARHLLQAGRRTNAYALDKTAAESAASAMHLLDVTRSGWQRVEPRAGDLLKDYYSHISRGIYQQVYEGLIASFGEACDIVDRERRDCYLDGPNDVDWVFRNQIEDQREGHQYVDMIVSDEGPVLASPMRRLESAADEWGWKWSTPKITEVLGAMHRLGLLTVAGLTAIEDAWANAQPMERDTHWLVVESLNREIVTEIVKAAPAEAPSKVEDARLVIDRWSFPLAARDRSRVRVSDREIEEERDRWLRAQC